MEPGGEAGSRPRRVWRFMVGMAALIAGVVAFTRQEGDEPDLPEPTDPRALLIHNEQVKARASLMNSVANACIGAGAITPFAVLAFGTPTGHRNLWFWGAGALMLVGAGWMLHRQAVRALEGLKI